MPDRLTTIDDTLRLVLSETMVLSSESCTLATALGRVIAQDVVAPHDVPHFDNSAMDGYAVVSVDTLKASRENPVTLPVTDTIPAGHSPTTRLLPGQAARIMTGAPLPEGADAVVQSESAEEVAGLVRIFEPADAGRNVRRAGGDVFAGTVVLKSGTVLGPAEIGMAASMGFPELVVHKRPRVAIVLTGSELVEVGSPLGPGQIHDSNGYSLRAQCQQLGIEPDLLGVAADDLDATRSLLSKGLGYDVLITTGGVSVGAFDFVKEVQEELGVKRLLWGVALKPGKPLFFGKRDSTLIFGLPGNPVSAMISFELFVRPALLRMMGHRETRRPVLKAVTVDDLDALSERVHVVRTTVWREGDVWKASSTGDQGSGRMNSMVGANGLVFVAAGSSGYRAGDAVDVAMLSAPSEGG